MKKISLTFLALTSLFFVSAASAEYPWETPHAKVLPTGDLEYAPLPYEFVAGESVRHIDFESGDDANPGTRAEPWKHHPWDAQATGKAKAAGGDIDTYVFKGGVTYRGAFSVPSDVVGTADKPIRLTRDPDWGDGPAVLNGAEVVSGWTRQAHSDMPDGNKVWSTEVDFLPRNLWLTKADDEPTRMKLARWPNWEVSDPLDHMAEWPTWDNPEWWTGNNKVTVDGKKRHIGIDDDLPEPLADLKDATVWTEWGIVMGSPYPAYVDAVIEEKNGLAFTDTWAPAAGNQIITGNRYYLENLPKFLDEPGEYWVEKTGKNTARIYLRLPGDADPNTVTVEAARHYDLIEASRMEHVHITGLTFRFGNLGWDYNNFVWATDNLEPAAIKLTGEGDGIVIAHNTFEHIHMPIRIAVGSPAQRIGTVSITDNRLRDTDHGAIWVENASPRGSDEMGHLEYVELLRNQLDDIGFRISRGGHGHAVTVSFPQHSQIAGNFLHRIAGWGIAAYGGKTSGRKGYTETLTRNLIHHNRVEDVILASNDWGGIETWQGGSHYTFNNVVINARAFKNWTFKPGDPENIGGFGHAYYMDGSFKNYLFNNIGLGVNNELGTKGVNATAIQNIISFENWYFNNSFHKFAETTRQQQPNAGRRYFLGNVFSDTSKMLFRHANPKDVAPDPNAEHYTQAGDFFYDTIAYAGNVI
ncbi:MAG: right-handed parallel beta-helix repeat-containing protein, partial [Puniceicoccaceae bacterium]